MNNKIVKEDPDSIVVNGGRYHYDDRRFVYQVFMLYKDVVDKKTYYFCYNPQTNEVISDNKQLVEEIKNPQSSVILTRKEYTKVDNFYGKPDNANFKQYIDEILNNSTGHHRLINILRILRRIKSSDDAFLRGRIFTVYSQEYVTFWDYKSRVLQYKDVILKMLKDLKLDPSTLYYQFEDMKEDSKFDGYVSSFESQVVTPKEPTEIEKRMLDLKKKIHMMDPQTKSFFLKGLGDKKPVVENYTKLLWEYMKKIHEGGKLFGTRASRVSTSEMNSIFDELKKRMGNGFSKFELSKSLPAKQDHGDIDIILTGNPNIKKAIMTYLGPKVKDYSRNDNIYSVLYSSDIGKDVHVDFIYADNDENFDAQKTYLALGDFSGILGVMARQNGYKYATTGFHKIYVDKIGRHHDILITKNLRDGLKILGYGDVLSTYDTIQTNDDVIKFISSSPLFDSADYEGQTMNHSDRKRVRSGRPSADYIRQSLIGINKRRSINDHDYFLKKLFPEKYQMLLDKQKEIEDYRPIKSKYGGEWIMSNFPQIKPGPILGKIKQFWTQKYGDQLDNVSEDELRNVTGEFLNKTL